jgi:glycosyltransferase involved in cell wall biosynthesis
MRLTVYTDADGYGGAEIATGDLLARLDDATHVTVMGTDRAVVEALAGRRAAAEVVVLPPVRRARDVGALLAHRRAIAAAAPDVFHAALPWPHACRWAILAASSVRGVRVVAVDHLFLPPSSARAARVKRWVERRLDAHVAVGPRVARSLERTYGLAAGSVRVIPNGVSPAPPDADAVPLPGPGPLVGTVARLDPVKGIDVLLRAVAQLPTARLAVVGRGAEEPALRELAAALGLTDRVTWLGWSDRPRAYLPAFTVFVLASRAEGLPLSICEAMLAGLPVVATDVGSVADVVVDGETGLLVPPDDPVALAGALRRVLDDPALAARLGSAGRRRAEAELTDEAMARRYEALYAELLGSGAPATRR